MVFFPTASALKASFDPNSVHAKSSSYWIQSSVEDKAKHLAEEAEAELAKVVKPNHQVELFSLEYYKYCTIGGIFGKLS